MNSLLSRSISTINNSDHQSLVAKYAQQAEMLTGISKQLGEQIQANDVMKADMKKMDNMNEVLVSFKKELQLSLDDSNVAIKKLEATVKTLKTRVNELEVENGNCTLETENLRKLLGENEVAHVNTREERDKAIKECGELRKRVEDSKQQETTLVNVIFQLIERMNV
jgi:regulator of replication initiation timing